MLRRMADVAAIFAKAHEEFKGGLMPDVMVLHKWILWPQFAWRWRKFRSSSIFLEHRTQES